MRPSFLRAQACVCETETRVQSLAVSTTVGALLLRPARKPQQRSDPSDVMPQVADPPVLTFVQVVPAAIATGESSCCETLLSPRPSCPCWFVPQQKSAPFVLI